MESRFVFRYIKLKWILFPICDGIKGFTLVSFTNEAEAFAFQ